jgi:hypothetical protein
MQRFNHAMAKAVEEALKRLLSEKHLYQSVEVDIGFVPKIAELIHAENRPMSQPSQSVDTVAFIGITNVSQSWTFVIHSGQGKPLMLQGSVGSLIQVQLPTINTYCDTCSDSWPFNPLAEGSLCVRGNGQNEWYFLGYQCQQCKGTAIRFLVRREGLKLRLSGRDPLEVRLQLVR